ncbi:MAG: universal stress protein [Bacteroidota bacterium]
MKTIIVPTDFSETAENALDYAIEMAKLMDSTILLLHVCQHTNASGNLSKLDLEKKKQKALRLLEQHIQKSESKITFELCLEPQNVVGKITELAKEWNAELIIFGVSNGLYEESVVGKNTSNAISNLATPVLMIPSKLKFRTPTKVVFAADYLELKNDRPLTALLNFILFFNSKLFIVNVKGADEKTSSKSIAVFLNVRKLIRNVNHSIHHAINESVVDGINEFVKERDAEIVAMIPHKHNLLYRLFSIGTVKKMAFKSTAPLLAIPEGIKMPVFVSNIPPVLPERIFEKEIQWFNEQCAI